MDEMFDRLNRIYPDSKFVLISKYNPEHWKNQEYDSSLDKKAALNKWKSNPLTYEEIITWFSVCIMLRLLGICCEGIPIYAYQNPK